MKFLKTIVISIGMILLGAMVLIATDSTNRINYYAEKGYTAGYLVNEGLTAVLDANNTAMIDTTNRYQLQRSFKTVPLTTTSAGVDTVINQLFTVPDGMTITLEEINLSAHLEIDEATDTLHLQIVRYSGTAKATMDTIVASFCVDNDSAIVYADTIYTMTLAKTSLTAGDIIETWLMAPGGAISAGDGAALTIRYRQDE